MGNGNAMSVADEPIAAEQTRTHRIACDVTRDLLQLFAGLRPWPELRDLAERFGILPLPGPAR